jgi:deoxynucleoside triphosphate triphosphohydrolase SAMHD1
MDAMIASSQSQSDLLTPVKRARVHHQSADHPVISPFHHSNARTSASQYSSYEESYQKKIFNDPIHHSIQLDDLTVKIMDTPQFQRLGKLKQLGTCSYVFRGATHTRFEHSIGVSYLAEKFAKHLQDSQPELGITKSDILCVNIAGLCHDLGHGPFSHVYDGVFLSLMNKRWRHEEGSVNMLRYLLQINDIRLEHYGLDAKDQLFIEEIILGIKESHRKGS